MTLQQEVSELIQRAGITRHRAAKLAGLDAQNVYTFLRCGKGLSVASVEKLRDVLSKSVAAQP